MTYVAIVLDRSGSMSSLRDVAIQGFNKQIETIKAEARRGVPTRVTLVTFNHDVNTLFFNADPSSLHPLDYNSYVPGGNTAEFDAIGETIERLERLEDAAEAAFLVIIISDGYENSSLRYNKFAVANLITRNQNTGRWTFAYIGSNKNLAEVQKDYHVHRGNILRWEHTLQGTQTAYATLSTATADYYSTRRMGGMQVNNYFAKVQDPDPAVPSVTTAQPLVGTTEKDTKEDNA